MTPAERVQWLATVELVLHLVERGIGCGADFRADKAPVVRLDALSGIEITAGGDRHYDVWDVSEPPLSPLAAWLSLDETLALLTAAPARA